MTAAAPSTLTPLEVASGLVIGVDAVTPEPAQPDRDPLEALEASILPALKRPPCIVSFSGGRDSSALLALAARVARREGLPLPVPVTNAFPQAFRTDEAAWQELVIRHVGLDDWVRNEFEDELDCVGPPATEILHRHGLLWPFNAHFALPVTRAAAGGSMLTGLGGDEALGAARWARVDALLSGRERPRPRDVLRIGLALAPQPLRAVVLRRRLGASFPWLVPDAEKRVLAAWAREGASEPFRWERRFGWLQTLRYLRTTQQSLATIGRRDGVLVVHPFAGPEFGSALAQLPPGRRFSTRSEAMRALFSDLLPEAVLTRVSKASFDEAFFNRYSRAFASRWNGESADPTLVDTDRLRAVWEGREPDARSFLLLQAAWLELEGVPAGTAGASRTGGQL